MLPLLLQLVRVLPCLLSAVGVCAALHTPARVDGAAFSAVGVGLMPPLSLGLAYVLSFSLLLG